MIDNFQLHGCPSNGSNETRSVVGGFEKATNDSFILQQTETTTYTNLTCDLYTYCKASAKMNGWYDGAEIMRPLVMNRPTTEITQYRCG